MAGPPTDSQAQPPFAAHVEIELWCDDPCNSVDSFQVQVFYQNVSVTSAMPFCGGGARCAYTGMLPAARGAHC